MQEHAEDAALPPLRIGVAGLGNVGATLVRILQKDGARARPKKLGRQVVVTAVSRPLPHPRPRHRSRRASHWFDDPVALAKSDDIDLFVELIGGEDGPAMAAVTAALEIGRPVVTANKALLARHGVALARLAEETGAQLGFEAAVAGGIPVIKTLREGLGSARIARVYGIMNGTCNYILTRMGNEGISLRRVPARTRRSWAMPRPTRPSTSAASTPPTSSRSSRRLCFGCEIAPDEIFVEGITTITEADIKVADDLGYKIKLLGIAQRSRRRHRAARAPDAGAQDQRDRRRRRRAQRRRARNRPRPRTAAGRPRRRRPADRVVGAVATSSTSPAAPRCRRSASRAPN